MPAYDRLRRGAPALPNSSPNLYPTAAVIPPQRAQQNPNEHERNWFSLTLSKIEMRKALPEHRSKAGRTTEHRKPSDSQVSLFPQPVSPDLSRQLTTTSIRKSPSRARTAELHFSNFPSHLLFHLFHRDWNAFLAQHAAPRLRDNYAILQADPTEIQVLFELRKIDEVRVDPFAPPLLY